MKQRELIIKFIIDMENYNRGIKHAENTMGGFAHKMTGKTDGTGKNGIFGKLGQSFSNMMTNRMGPNPVSGVLSQITGSLGRALPIMAAVTVSAGLMWNAISAGTKAETTLTSLSVMTGSMSEAKRIYKEVVDFTAKTPLLSEQTTPAAKQLLAVKYTADQLIPTMRMIGDVATGSGKNFNELISIMAKNKSSGIIQGEDLNQLIDAGIPILDEFGRMFNKTGIEIRKMASQSKLTYQDLEQAFKNMTTTGGIYDSMMVKQSKTVAGILSTMKDNASLISLYMSGVLEPEGKPTMWTNLVATLDMLQRKIAGFVEETKGFWTDLGTLIGNMISLIGNVINLVTNVLGPAFSAVLPILQGIVNVLSFIFGVFNKIFEVVGRIVTGIKDGFDRLFGITEKIKLAKNEMAGIWAIFDVYVTIQMQKLEKWLFKHKDLIMWFSKQYGFEIVEPGVNKNTPQNPLQRPLPPEERQNRNNQMETDKNKLSPELFEKKNSNVNNSRNVTNNHQVIIVNTNKDGADRYITNTTGKPIGNFLEAF